MIIKQITEIKDVFELLPVERTIRNKGRDHTKNSDMLLFIQAQLQNPYFGIWVAHDGDKIMGYMIALMSLMPGYKKIHILRVFSLSKDIVEEFRQILKKWGKPHNINTIEITVTKRVRSIQKVWGFLPVSINMERRI